MKKIFGLLRRVITLIRRWLSRLSVNSFLGQIIILIIGVFTGLFLERMYNEFQTQTQNQKILYLMLAEVASNQRIYENNKALFESSYNQLEEFIKYSDSLYYYNLNNSEVYEGIISKFKSFSMDRGYIYNTNVHDILSDGGTLYSLNDIDLILEIENYYAHVNSTQSQMNRYRDLLDFRFKPRNKYNESLSFSDEKVQVVMNALDNLKSHFKYLRDLNQTVDSMQNKKLAFFVKRFLQRSENQDIEEHRKFIENIKLKRYSD